MTIGITTHMMEGVMGVMDEAKASTLRRCTSDAADRDDGAVLLAHVGASGRRLLGSWMGRQGLRRAADPLGAGRSGIIIEIVARPAAGKASPCFPAAGPSSAPNDATGTNPRSPSQPV